MADIVIKWIDKIRSHKLVENFFQRMANRLLVGQLRYGEPVARQKYFERLKLEVKAYQKTGNAEHLINIANYSCLEEIAPCHPKFHFNSEVESVTRKKFGV